MPLTSSTAVAAPRGGAAPSPARWSWPCAEDIGSPFPDRSWGVDLLQSVAEQRTRYSETETELDWDRYRATYGNIGRLDLILEAEGDSTNRYKLAKPADVLMLLYVLGPDQLLAQLDRLGYTITLDALGRTVDFYLARTARGSTLSRVVHASVLARLDPAQAWELFRDALVADLDDTQGGTTAEGVHLGAMAGSIDIVTRAFAGMALADDHVVFAPRLPDGLRHVEFQIHHRGQLVHVSLTHARLRLTAAPGTTGAGLRVDVAGSTRVLPAGDVVDFALGDVPAT